MARLVEVLAVAALPVMLVEQDSTAPEAFTPDGRALIETLFERAIAAPEDEARRGFACNALCPDGRHVLIQRGNTVTNSRLEAAGLEVLELDTGEFMKSGGSVFCMKLLHGPL